MFLSTILLFFATLKKRHLVFSPSDFLLITLPVVLLLIPEPFKSEYHLDAISLKSIAVFVALRATIKRRARTAYHLRSLTAAALLFVALVGVWGLRIVY